MSTSSSLTPSSLVADSSLATASTSSFEPSLTFDMVQLILKRRRQEQHSDEELEYMIHNFTHSRIPDYQMAAWLMAVCCGGDYSSNGGLTARETATLTRCLVESGQQLQWRQSQSMSTVPEQQPRQPATIDDQDYSLVDKHSTGGVGDKVSIVLAPLLVACGCTDNSASSQPHFKLRIPMLAGRGLGHTGGTIDKLEAIPGFRTNLSVDEFQNQVMSRVGCSIAAASADLVCPADQKLYALRDVTGTVSSVALQTASIMSKKIAERPDSLLLDCKYGSGSFQATRDDAERLAHSMVETGEANGIRPTVALLTRMDHPLGTAVGNWLEILECIEILQGNFHKRRDLVTLIVMQAAYMMQQMGQFRGHSVDDLVLLAMDNLLNGKAFVRFRDLVAAQGGNVSVVDDPQSYPMAAKYSTTILAKQDGFISSMDALVFGQVAVHLGAGRLVADEAVDPCAGIWLHCQVGDAIKAGDKLVDVYTDRDGILGMETKQLEAAIEYSNTAVDMLPIVSDVVSKQGTLKVSIPWSLTEQIELSS